MSTLFFPISINSCCCCKKFYCYKLAQVCNKNGNRRGEGHHTTYLLFCPFCLRLGFGLVCPEACRGCHGAGKPRSRPERPRSARSAPPSPTSAAASSVLLRCSTPHGLEVQQHHRMMISALAHDGKSMPIHVYKIKRMHLEYN